MRHDARSLRPLVRDSWNRSAVGEVEFDGKVVLWSSLTLGQRVAWHRCRNGWSQMELAMRADTSQSAIGRLEKDREEALRITTLRRIAEALGVCCGELLD